MKSQQTAENELRKQIIQELLDIKKEEYQSLIDTQKDILDPVRTVDTVSPGLAETTKPTQVTRRIEMRTHAAAAIRTEIEQLQQLDHSGALERVAPGAVMSTNHGQFIVAVPATAFAVKDQYYRGISTEGPLFRALEGKEAGASVDVQGVHYEIQSIY